jgi:hypothetical protein
MEEIIEEKEDSIKQKHNSKNLKRKRGRPSKKHSISIKSQEPNTKNQNQTKKRGYKQCINPDC